MREQTCSRKLRGFMRWMEVKDIQMSDGLQVVQGESKGIACGELGVRAAYDFQEGDAIASIPKDACLTLRTTGAAHALEEAQLSGGLGLVAALMYECSLGEASPWFPYLNLMPVRHEGLPIVWERAEIDTLLLGTELHQAHEQVVLEDQRLMEEDWKECIWPLTQRYPHDFLKDHFTLEHYFAAKTLVASRSFEVDEFHGFGMVPLADLFNHKTGDEDVHIMRDSDCDSIKGRRGVGKMLDSEEEGDYPDHKRPAKMIRLECDHQSPADSASESSEGESERSGVLDIVLIKNVLRGSEIFNTYGELGNASLLHRHGFTEPENPFDLVNIDYTLVVEYCSFSLSKRHVRNRVRLWRKYGCSAYESQNTSYFEIVASGKPQPELLFLLYVVHLSDTAFHAADVALHQVEAGEKCESALQWADKVTATMKNLNVAPHHHKPSGRGRLKRFALLESMQEARDFEGDGVFYTVEVCKGLLWLCERRDEAYGQTSLEEDVELVKVVSPTEQPKLFHALSLRVSERSILKKFKCFIHEQLGKALGAVRQF